MRHNGHLIGNTVCNISISVTTVQIERMENVHGWKPTTFSSRASLHQCRHKKVNDRLELTGPITVQDEFASPSTL